MGNRSHLRPEMTVDKNGRATTVYVSRDDDSPRFSMLSSVAPTLPSYEDEDEWESSGLENAESWQDNEFALDDAQNWEAEGFDAETAYTWRANDFDSSEAYQWKTADFSPDDAAGWKGVCTPDVASQWSKAGYDVHEAESWISEGYDPDEAKGWISAGIDSASTAKDWADNGMDHHEAEEWSGAGFTDPATAAEWRGEARRVRNLKMDDLVTLYDAGTDAQDAPMWLSVLDTVHSHGNINETMGTVLSTLQGVNPSAGDEYANYFPYSKWSMLSSNGIDYDQVKYVDDLKNAVSDHEQDEYGDDYEDDPDGELEAAVHWVSATKDISKGKAQVMRRLILAGESVNSSREFLSSTEKASYDGTDECLERIRAAQKWARTADEGEETAAFDQLYSVLSKDIDLAVFNQMVEQHGVSPVRSAISQGLTSEAQVRNYLEYARVASISEGAL